MIFPGDGNFSTKKQGLRKTLYESREAGESERREVLSNDQLDLSSGN